MKHLIIIILLVLSACDQNTQVQSTSPVSMPIKTHPLWTIQNIDSIPACQIILMDNMSIIKVGNTYTSIYKEGSFYWYKSDKNKTGLDYDTHSYSLYYYPDSCQLKESLRSFIKLHIVEYIQNNLK